MGTYNLDYGMCEFYSGVIAYTRSQPIIAEQHLLNADAVFRDVMNESPDNDYSKNAARFLYSLDGRSQNVIQFFSSLLQIFRPLHDMSNRIR